MTLRVLAGVVTVGLALVACTSAERVDTTTVVREFPNVVEVDVHQEPEGTYRFDVTISSPYDSPERYADAWRVRGPDGTVYGVRELLHDHAAEQPFTRSLSGVEIPEDVDTVVVEGRDLQYGWGGETVGVDLP